MIASGCDIGGGGRCTVQSRTVDYAAETRRGALVGTAFFQLSETRGAEDREWVMWHVRVAPPSNRAVHVSLREGTPESPGPILYEFPIANTVPDSGVLTQVFVRTPYAGAVPFSALWERAEREPVSFLVLIAGDAQALRIGPLVRAGFSDWQDACS